MLLWGGARARRAALLWGDVPQIRERESTEILSWDLSGNCYHNYATQIFLPDVSLVFLYL